MFKDEELVNNLFIDLDGAALSLLNAETHEDKELIKVKLEKLQTTIDHFLKIEY